MTSRSYVDRLRKDAETFMIEQGEMGWKNWAFGKDVDQTSLYKRYEYLFSRDAIAAVSGAMEAETDPDQKRALEYFRAYLMFEHIGKQLAGLSDEITNYESHAAINVNREAVPYRQAIILLANEDDQAKRLKIYTACDDVLDNVNPLEQKMEEITRAEAQDLGFSSYIDMCSALKKCDYYDLEQSCMTILEETDQIYAELLAEGLKEIGLTPEQFVRSDSWRMNRDTSFDRYFTEELLIDTMRASLRALGMDLESQTNILVDSEKRDKKYARAVCFNIVVPSDIRVSIKPTGGAEDYRSLFHEMGHAEHFANTKQDIWEFQQLGDYTFTENFAFLFEHLLSERGWLERYTSMTADEIQRFLRSQALKRLWYVRRYCAKFVYELKLHAGVSEPGKVYSEILSRALKYKSLPSDEKRYLDDVDAAFYSADYLRAWLLEMMLKERLREKFGQEWFESREAGEYIMRLMGHGQKMHVDEYVRMLGYDGVTSEPLIREIRWMAGKSEDL